ncbi:MAG: hypothetical protein K9J37_18460 [Saprospiraceae bacterium]|nr:hypothetical protein [Saprospiraceae bacterium]MCF8251904.1 hypothetical protein [Saprospiraceae bacterium]MCF8281603.1 hypothetical protein [Bacteroidales bacterium]MCF8313580.1 hypothetical protein [Saprospiraceae bacterium]MCF8442288.1 hypothetical protein [Saprospiraceae bacterium]
MISFALQMKKVTATILLSLFLFSALLPAQVREDLVKFSALLQHFQEHQAESPGLTFLDFYKMHYGEEFTKHQGDHDHSKLPGKEVCNHLHAPVPAVLPSAILTVKPVPTTAQNKSVFADQSYSFSLPQDIWQPPRAV